MNLESIIAILLAIVTGIVANLMTPYFKRFPLLYSFYRSRRSQRRIILLMNELAYVRAFHKNPPDFYLYILHKILFILGLIFLVAFYVSLMVILAPKYSYYFSMVVLPAAFIYLHSQTTEAMKFIIAVRFFEEYEMRTLHKLKALNGKEKEKPAA